MMSSAIVNKSIDVRDAWVTIDDHHHHSPTQTRSRSLEDSHQCDLKSMCHFTCWVHLHLSFYVLPMAFLACCCWRKHFITSSRKCATNQDHFEPTRINAPVIRLIAIDVIVHRISYGQCIFVLIAYFHFCSLNGWARPQYTRHFNLLSLLVIVSI